MTGSDEDVNFILYNLKVYESLCIGTDKLSVNYALPYQISCKYVHIFHSSFITLDDVLSMKETVDIQIERSSFTNQDLEVLFQHWISGKLPKLEFLMISGVKLTGEMKIGDLETLWGPNAVFVEKQICGKYRRIHAPVPLQRNDGVVGNVNFRNSDDHDYPASIRLLV
uniref:FBA_2 domain-containing protein n=1 Tax=Caenorhabditis tropicalis TaxID=1561998 RepID=A0A1I7TUL3_9PELO